MKMYVGKVHRCGYCGHPTDPEGTPITGKAFERAMERFELEPYEQTYGICCAHKWARQERYEQITSYPTSYSNDLPF